MTGSLGPFGVKEKPSYMSAMKVGDTIDAAFEVVDWATTSGYKLVELNMHSLGVDIKTLNEDGTLLKKYIQHAAPGDWVLWTNEGYNSPYPLFIACTQKEFDETLEFYEE